MKKLLAILLVALLAFSFVACGDEETNNDDLENAVQPQLTLVANKEGSAACSVIYGVNEEGTYEITGLIHDGVSELHVEISTDALAALDREITGIADEAFKSCKNLASITIPDTVTYIGKAAFYDCDALKSIALPQSVSVVKTEAFKDCDALTIVSAKEGTIKADEVEKTIGLATIEEFAFESCDALNKVILPNTTLKTIGMGAFKDCKALPEIKIPTSVDTLGSLAFGNCEKLTSVIALGNPSSIAKLEGKGDYLFTSNMNVTVTVTSNSTMHKYAMDNGINYVVQNAGDPYINDF